MAVRAVQVKEASERGAKPPSPSGRLKNESEKKYAPLARRFMLSKTEEKPGRDGVKYRIHTRLGPSGGAFTTDDLLEIFGFKAKLAKYERDLTKRHEPDSDEFKENYAHERSRLVGKVSGYVALYRRRLEAEYAEQGIIPLFTKVRIHSEDEEPRLFIQGFMRPDSKKEKFVLGNRDDGALWAIVNKSRTESKARVYSMSVTLGREFMQGALTDAVKQRLNLAFQN
jgi:hypothetical protein